MECSHCGDPRPRPTSSGWLDDIRAFFGSVLFRCVRCGRRTRVRLWPWNHFIFAHCPRCHSDCLQRWHSIFLPGNQRVSLKKLLGAKSYRCYDCSHAFLSLRPRRITKQMPVAPTAQAEKKNTVEVPTETQP